MVDSILSPDLGCRCICRLGPKWPQVQGAQQLQVQRRMPRMQMLSVRAVSAGQVAYIKRIAYVSGHAVQQGALVTAPPASPAASPMKQTLISSFTTSSQSSGGRR